MISNFNASGPMKFLRNLILMALTLLAVANILKGSVDAIRLSPHDFSMRWMSTKLMLAGENGYQMERSDSLSDRAREILNDNPGVHFANSYLPSSNLMFIPFAIMPYNLAAFVWLVVTLLSTALLLLLLVRLLRGNNASSTLIMLVVLLFLSS